MNTNPKRGPFHQKAPREIFRRAVRGMVPYRTKRGDTAMKLLKVAEGVPVEYQKRNRRVVESALKVYRLNPCRKSMRVGQLSSLFGWKYADVISKMEEKRKKEGSEYAKQKQEERKRLLKAKEECKDKLAEINETLQKYGYN